MIDAAVYQQFRAGLLGLAERVPPVELPDAERVRRAKAVFLQKIDAHVATDLEACVHCGQCAEACHFYVGTQEAKYTPIHKLDLLRRFYRRELAPMRWLYRLVIRDITVADLREWQMLVYDSCTECGRCSMICPMGIDIAAMVNTMRQALARAGLAPAELQGLEQEQGGAGTLFGVGIAQLDQFVKKMAASGRSMPIDKEKADVVLLTSVIEIFLFQDSLIAAAKILNHLGLNWTLRSHGYEAANFGLLSGYEDVQRIATRRVIDAAIACGAKTVIVPECGHAYPALRWEGADEYGKPLPFEVLVISEFLGREVTAGRLKLKPLGPQKKIAFHDPCKVARVGGATKETQAAVAALRADLRHTDPEGEMNWCCGGGAGVFVIARAAPLRQKAFEIKMKQVDTAGADSVVVTCASCRLNFLQGAQTARWDKPIESLVELTATALVERAEEQSS
jgi:Fe-S oxidoreductase